MANELQPIEVLRHTYHFRQEEEKECLPVHIHTPQPRVLEVTDASKYLGVKVMEDLTWSRHISEVAGKANRTLGFLRRNFRQCTKEVKAATYSTMVRPVLDYASTVWDPHQQGDIKILEQVQRRAARYVYNDWFLDISAPNKVGP